MEFMEQQPLEKGEAVAPSEGSWVLSLGAVMQMSEAGVDSALGPLRFSVLVPCSSVDSFSLSWFGSVCFIDF